MSHYCGWIQAYLVQEEVDTPIPVILLVLGGNSQDGETAVPAHEVVLGIA